MGKEEKSGKKTDKAIDKWGNIYKVNLVILLEWLYFFLQF